MRQQQKGSGSCSYIGHNSQENKPAYYIQTQN